MISNEEVDGMLDEAAASPENPDVIEVEQADTVVAGASNAPTHNIHEDSADDGNDVRTGDMEDSDSDEESLTAAGKRKRSKPSPVWKYATKVTNGAKCNICGTFKPSKHVFTMADIETKVAPVAVEESKVEEVVDKVSDVALEDKAEETAEAPAAEEVASEDATPEAEAASEDEVDDAMFLPVASPSLENLKDFFKGF